jgi:retron-type reverse transcriptase
MKREGNLYDKLCSMDNLILADANARRGKIHRYGIKKFDRNRDVNLQQLRSALLSGTFKTSAYDVFKVFEPKERTIFRLPYFPDRIVHHAIMNVLEPIWVSIFTSDTFGCIKGRGIHAALKRLKIALKDVENTTYCLKLDVKKFYESIDHNVLKMIVRRKIKDVRMLHLLDEIIDSADGVPIGNYLSQYFANLYLAYFDHWIKEEKGNRYYFRYADDMVILHADKKCLRTLFFEIQSYFSANLKLEIKKNWQIFPTDSRGIDFLGYVSRHTHVIMRKSIKKRFMRKVAKLRKRGTQGREFRMQISPWFGWAKHCDTKNLLKKVL